MVATPRALLTLGVATLVPVLALTPPTQADTIRVPADQPTIQAGINAATTGDVVLVAPGTYVGVGNRDIEFFGKGIVVRSEGGPEVTVIDCQQESRAFHFHYNETAAATLEGFSIRNGSSACGGGIRFGSGFPSIINCILSDNSAGEGGAVCSYGSSPSFSNCTFSGNSASHGGALYDPYSSATFTNCTFSYNVASASDGGAIGAIESSSSFNNCTFSANSAARGGGAVNGGPNASPIFNHCTFSGNSAAVSGGAIAIFTITPGATFTIDNCIFSENSTEGSGGAFISYSSRQSTLRNSTFYGNSAANGSAIYNGNSSTPVIADKCIMAFSSRGNAVDCYQGYAPPALTCCDVYGNAGGDWVGCIANQLGQEGNFSADPLFRSPENGDFFLQPNSPCLPDQHPDGADCGVIGIDQELTISASTERNLYQNGVEMARLTVTTRRNWGEAGSLDLAVDLEPSLGPTFHVGDDSFVLGLGEEHVSQFFWPLPDTSYAWEFHGDLTFSGPGQRWSWLRRIRSWFHGTPVEPAVVQQHQQIVVNCFQLAPGMRCQAQANDMMPALGSIPSLGLMADSWCRSTELYREGRPEAGHVAFLDGAAYGLQMLENLAITTLAEAAFGSGGAVPSGVILQFVGVDAEECANRSFIDELFGGPSPNGARTVPDGVLVDSLAAWAAIGIEAMGGLLPADMLFVEGDLFVRVEADTAWATADSIGLVAARVTQLDTLGVVAITTPHVHGFRGDESENPHSLTTFRMHSMREQNINIGLLHLTQDSVQIYLRYPEFGGSEETIVLLTVTDEQETYPLFVDLDGDGQIDETLYPAAAGVGEEAASLGTPRLGLDLNRPNPFNPTTTIAFSLPSRSRAVLTILDASGRVVARPFDGLVEAGDHQVVWNGRTKDGAALPSGVYFYRLDSAGITLAGRMVMVR